MRDQTHPMLERRTQPHSAQIPYTRLSVGRSSDDDAARRRRRDRRQGRRGRELDELDRLHALALLMARERADDIARRTGMTTTQVIEEVLRAYTPPTEDTPPGRLIRKGPLLVMPATGPTVTLEELNEAIEAIREERE